jgi:hypothetical protein
MTFSSSSNWFALIVGRCPVTLPAPRSQVAGSAKRVLPTGASKAFRPEPGTRIRARLEAGYRDSRVLVSRAAQPPTFGRILARIEENAALL